MVSLGDMAVLLDEHVGVGDDFSSYALHPGDSGLVLAISNDEDDTVTLLISGHIIYVRASSVEKIEV